MDGENKKRLINNIVRVVFMFGVLFAIVSIFSIPFK